MKLSIEFDLFDDSASVSDDLVAHTYATSRDRVEAFINGPDDDDNTLLMAQAALLLEQTSSAFAEEVHKEVTDTVAHYLATAIEATSGGRLVLHG